MKTKIEPEDLKRLRTNAWALAKVSGILLEMKRDSHAGKLTRQPEAQRLIDHYIGRLVAVTDLCLSSEIDGWRRIFEELMPDDNKTT